MDGLCHFEESTHLKLQHMSRACSQGGNKLYHELYQLDQYGGVVLRDGRGSRQGGPRCANDARGRRERQSAVLRDDGALVVLPFAEAQPLRAGMGEAELKTSEVTSCFYCVDFVRSSADLDRRCRPAGRAHSYDRPSRGSYWGDTGEEDCHVHGLGGRERGPGCGGGGGATALMPNNEMP